MTAFQLITLFSFFSLSVLAIPLVPRAISASLFSTFNLDKQFSAAAYCPLNNNSPNTKIVCTADACPLVEAADTNTLIEFQNTAGTDATGYLAVDTTNELIVLSFRGSESIKNYLTDLNFVQVPIDICDGCQGDLGFWSSWVEVRSMVISTIESATAANPGFKIIATGHSLGGAIATFAAAELRNQNFNVDLVTFGSPRVGDRATATYITNQRLGSNYRITHLNDPVPRLPPTAFNYLHISPEYYISSPNNAAVTTADIQICTGLGNSDCNAKWLITDISAHSWYFGAISACYPKGTIEV